MAMARKAYRGKGRRRRSRFDMQSVKFCQQGINLVDEGSLCDDPEQVIFTLARPGEIGAIGLANEINELGPTKGLVIGGMTFDAWWTHSAADDNIGDNSFGFYAIWEAVYVQSLDEFGFPTYVPRLSDPNLGADRDVDLLWKRVTMLPVWSIGQVVTNQITATGQNTPDHVRVKSRRRLSEKHGLFYSACFLPDDRLRQGVFGHKLIFNAWFRIAVKQWR